MVEVESTYIPHEWIPLEFFEGEPSHGELDVESNIDKWVPPQNAKDLKPSWPYKVLFFVITFMPLLFHFRHILHDSRYGNWPHLCRYACGYGPKIIVETTLNPSNEDACLIQLLIKRLYISYLDCKHKKGSWHLHKNLAISIRRWVLHHLTDVFYFQDVGEVNGIHIPFTIGI
jgi:hypothetical protein